MFYNEAKLIAEPYPRPRRHELFHWDKSALEETTPLELDVSARILREGGRAVDDRFRYDERAYTDRDILLRSLTYESDEIARELNIVDQLPCILIVDDPASVDFHTLSLAEADDQILTDLRDLFSAFMKDPSHKRYLDTLRKWHNANNKLQALKNDMNSPSENSIANQAFIISHIQKGQDLLMADKPKAFRAVINEMESRSGNVGTINWKDIREKSKKVGQMFSIEKRLSSSTLTDEKRQNMETKARELLCGCDNNLQGSDLYNKLRQRCVFIVNELSESIAYQLGIRERSFAQHAQRIRESLDEYQSTLTRCESELQSLERPRIGPHIQALQRKRRNSRTWSYVKSTVGATISKAPCFLDVIKKGLDLLSIG